VSELGDFRAHCDRCGADVTFVAPRTVNAGRGRPLVDLLLAGADPSVGTCSHCGATVTSDDPWFCADFPRSVFLACVPRLFAEPSGPDLPTVREHLDPLVPHLRLLAGDAVLTLTPDAPATREKLLAAEAGIDWLVLEAAKVASGRGAGAGAAAGAVARLVAVESGRCAFEVYGPGGRHAGVLEEFTLARSAVDAAVGDPGLVRVVGDGVQVVDARWAPESARGSGGRH
jgi:hypothetical protein